MMEIEVVRKEFTENSTIGDFLIDGDFFCHSLEDRVREPGVKVYGGTAISEGGYDLIIDQSARFRRAMPHILNVPGFEGIRIHAGNTSKDTEGCILLGFTKEHDSVGRSKEAFNKFFDLLHEALIHEKAFIAIRRETA
jgi:hypothetical protein